MIRACPRCGSSVSSSAFCPVCGAALPPAPSGTRPAGASGRVLAVVAAVLVVAVVTVLVVLQVNRSGVGGTAIAGPDGGGSAPVSSGTGSSTKPEGSRVTSDLPGPTAATGSSAVLPGPGGTGTADTNRYRSYALAEGQPLTQDASGYALYFSSPTGNIHCSMSFGTADQDGDATCFIGQRQWTGPSAPADCTANWADNYVAVSVAGVQSGRCLSDVPVPPVSNELPYGTSLSTGVVTCASAETGVTCMYLASGHGFTLNRAALTPF